MRRRHKKRLRQILTAILCVPVLGAGFISLRQLMPADAATQTAVLAGSFLAAPRAAAEAMGQLVTIEDDSKTQEPSGGGFWTQVTPQATPAPTTGQTTETTEYEKPENAGTVVDAVYTGKADNVTVQSGSALIKNVTDLSNAEVLEALAAQLPFTLEKNTSEPQVLIMHTHATECFHPTDTDWYDPNWPTRSTDITNNIVAVGKVLADTLNAAGIVTLQDATLHDYPSYNGSYDRSKVTVESYLAKYPSIKIVLDVHRDAIEKEDGTRIRPVVELDGVRYAQMMIICGADNGKMNMPNFRQNLKFAGSLQQQLSANWQNLARPVLFDYRNYNQQLTTGSLLVEIGGHANTLEQAKASAALLGQAIISLAE